MRQLPLLNELWQESLKRDDFTIISVAGDDLKTMPRLRKALRDNHVQFPVLHYLDGDEGGQFDYDVHYYSYDMLIDPQGVIVGNVAVRKDFTDMIEYLDAHAGEIPRIAVDMYKEELPVEGFTAHITVSRSDHQPLPLYCGGWYQYHHSEAGTRPDKFLDQGDEGSERVLEYGDFGDTTFEITAEPRDDLKRVYFWVWIPLPGAELLNDGDGLPVISSLDLRFDEDGNLIRE